jgi:hypothetical protein
MEGTVLSSGFAFMPVVDLCEAHASGKLFSLDALDHALVEGIAGVCLH